MKLGYILKQYDHLLTEAPKRDKLADPNMPAPPAPGDIPQDSETGLPGDDLGALGDPVPPEQDITQPQEPVPGEGPGEEKIQPLTSAGEHDLIKQIAQALTITLDNEDSNKIDDLLGKFKGGIIKPEHTRNDVLPKLQAIMSRYSVSDADADMKNNPATASEFPEEDM